jgi:integrase
LKLSNRLLCTEETLFLIAVVDSFIRQLKSARTGTDLKPEAFLKGYHRGDKANDLCTFSRHSSFWTVRDAYYRGCRHCSGHTFRENPITDYQKNGSKLEVAQKMAGHSSSRTTGVYDRHDDDITPDEVERIAI